MDIENGIPQAWGSVMSPTLFSIAINDPQDRFPVPCPAVLIANSRTEQPLGLSVFSCGCDHKKGESAVHIN